MPNRLNTTVMFPQSWGKSLTLATVCSFAIGCGGSNTAPEQTESKPAPEPVVAESIHIAQQEFNPAHEIVSEPKGTVKLKSLNADSVPVQPIKQTRRAPEIQTAAMSIPQDVATDYSAPPSGTPEWNLQEIAKLLSELNRSKVKTDQSISVVQTEEINRRIVALATNAITETHFRPEKEHIFNAAVHSLMEARLALALSGDLKSQQQIYEDAETLTKQRPESMAASTATTAVIRLSEEMAHNNDSDSPWLSEYVRQTKLFAANFPGEEARAIVQLTSAAEFCEQRKQVLPAIECYTMIQQTFPQSPFAQKVDKSLARLNLVGHSIPIDGPTIDGEQVQLADFAGQPILVAFWSSKSAPFVEDLPLIKLVSEQTSIQVLGINMDHDEDVVRQFLTATQLPGKHIFYQDSAARGAGQPLARQFGINIVPSYWLIDAQGTVKSTNVSRKQLQEMLTEE